MNFAAALPWMLLAVLAACGSPPPAVPQVLAREVVAGTVLEAYAGAELVAIIRRLEVRDPSGPIAFYRIEDPRGRWLGHATAQGRFSRRVPFRDEEEDLGVLAMARGVAELTGQKDLVRLVARPAPDAAPR
ncbi:MAG: hypothetical protein FJ301_01705 [Planctomycetes bacterium]|nr:hypothetical protein [Planctomycetota bacterium]